MRMVLSGIALLVLAGGASAAVPQSAPPTAEQKAVFAAAGYFTARDGHLVNGCGQAAHPAAMMADLNGDGVPEAVVMELSPCYKDGKHFAIVHKSKFGVWLGMVREDGGVIPAATRTGGWLDMNVTAGGKTLRYTHQLPNGVDTYLPAAGPAAAVAPAPAGRGGVAHAGGAAASAPAAGGPATIAGAPLPAKATQLSAAQKNALMLAGGFKKVAGQWKGCDGTSDAAIADGDGGVEGGAIRDLNGDGRAEVIITDGGYECYGNTGQAFTILTEDAAGKWKELWSSVGIATVQTTRTAGWLDVEVGGPGFCFAVYTWQQGQYEIAYYNEYMKGICAENGLKPARKKY